MAKIIGVSGPQGAGKTTLINGLFDKGVFVDNYKVSRDVQQALGWESLDNVLNEVDTMIEFQNMILQRKIARERLNAGRAEIYVLSERTFADIASYTQLWTWELVHAGKWPVGKALEFLIEYVETCAEYQHVYEGILLLPYMSHMKWEHDKHRASEAHVDFISEQLDRFLEAKTPRSVPVFRITESSVDGRINQAHDWIKTL